MSDNKQTGVEVQLSGQDGNIFSIVGRAQRAMKRAGFTKEAKEMAIEVTNSHSYSEALEVIADYVEVE
jgi:hypothetical protein